MHDVFMQSMYALLSDTTQKTGNVVDGKDFKTGFIEMLEKIKFGVDRWGVPSHPELHVHPSFVPKLEQYHKEAGAEYLQKVRELTSAREREAILDEARRICRYKRSG